MKARLIQRLLIVIAMPGLAGYAFFISNGGSKPVSNHSSRPPLKTDSKDAEAWLFNQRAYPTGRIPAGAAERAWRASMQAIAPQLDALTSGGDYWTNIGPAPVMGGQIIPPEPPANLRVTGRIVDIAVDPAEPEGHWFIAAASGGIWETTDAGESWTPKTDQEASLVTQTVTIAPSDPRIIFSGITDISNTGVGLLRSGDSGATWELQATSVFGGRQKLRFSAVRVDPTDANIVLAMTWQNQLPTTGGLFKSTDGGAHFSTPILAGGGTALEINPTNFNQQYAAIRNPAVVPAVQNNGIYRSMDGGNTWAPISGPWASAIANQGEPVKIAIGPPSAPGIAYVVVPGGGMWKTENAWDALPGWVALPPTLDGASTHAFDTLVDPTDGYFYAAGYGEASNPNYHELAFQRFKLSWTKIVASTHVDQHALAASGSTLLLGNDGGFWISQDHGNSWINKNANLAVIQFYAGSLHPDDATAALGGGQDNGTELWSGSPPWNFKFGGDGGYSAFSKYVPGTWLVSANDLSVWRLWNNGAGYMWAGSGLDTGGASFIAPIRRSPNSDIVLAGSNNLWKSTNFFTAGTPTWTSHGPEMGAAISAIAFAPSDPTSKYAFGAENGALRLTTTGGSTRWTNFDLSNLVPDRPVKAIAFLPTHPQVIYVALSGFDANTPSTPGHVFKTNNYGATWTEVSPRVNGVLVDVPMNALAIDPTDTNTIYAGADLGVWKSTNGGTSWSFMGPTSGMPNVPVLDLLFGPDNHLVAFTLGRGAFKLNVGTLQVTITPPGAVNARAKWKVDNGVFQESGTTVSGLAPGNHTITFSSIGGYHAPANQVASISLNQTTTSTAVYYPDE